MPRFLSVCVVSAAVLSCLLPRTVACQGQRKPAAAGKASISGFVTDTNGTPVAGADVVLTSLAGLKQEMKSDEKGLYSFAGLHSGTYNLSVTAPNFPPQKFENITISAGQEIPFDFTLQGVIPKPVVNEPAKSTAPAEIPPPPQNPVPPSAEAPAQTEAQKPAQTVAPSSGSGKTSISGVASDPTGAVIPGATVVLTKSGVLVRKTETDANGRYEFTRLDAGTYDVSLSAPNFGEQILHNVALGAEPAQVTLQPAKSAEQVEVVSGGAANVETETASVSGTITEKEVVSIGLNGRNFTQLIALAPGVSNQTGQDEAKVGVVGSVKYSVNGGRVEYNTFEVDGSDVLNTGLNGASSTLMVYPSLDAIQEVKVLTSNYGSQYGRTASGTVQVTTKSGTEKLHGNIYDFIRNEAFNSRNFFDFAGFVQLPGQTQGHEIGGKAPLYRRQDFGGTIGGPFSIPKIYQHSNPKTHFFFSEEFRLEKTPVEYNQAVPSLKERGLVMTSQGIQPNLVTAPNGQVYQDFDFTDVCPAPGSSDLGGFSRQQYPDCPSLVDNGTPGNLLPISGNHLLIPSAAPGQRSLTGVDKNAETILNSNLLPVANSLFGCNYSIINLDATDPNHCYVAAVSPPTYWREELFRIDQDLTSRLKASFRYIHDAWDTTTLSPQWSILRTTNPGAATFPTVENRFIGPGTNLVARFTHTISSTLLNVVDLSYTNSSITLSDLNGPGGAVFQRNPSLGQPLVTDPSAPGQCNPTVSVDPVTGLPQCGMGYIFNNGFGGKMPTVEVLGTNAAYGGRGFAMDAGYMPWGHSNPTYAARDDVTKALGKHTLQFGAQYTYAQRNQTNNTIGAASGDTQGLLTFSNLTRSTGNAFADFLIQYNTTVAVQSFIQGFTQDSTQRRYYQRYQIGEPYFQDDWKITRKLTLNLGLRVSLFGTYREANHTAWNWEASRFNLSRFAVDPRTGVLLDKTAGSVPVTFDPATFQLDPSIVTDLGLYQCGVQGTPSGCMKEHLFNPAPRVGFAWDPWGNGKTAIRGGYGVFFEHGTGNESNTGSLEASAPLVLSVTQPFPLNYYCIGNVGFGAAFDPSNSACTTNSQLSVPPAGSLFPIDVTSIPTKAIWPYVQQWSFGVQRELPQSFVTTVSYIGSKGTHLTLEQQLNQLHPLAPALNPFGPAEPLTIEDCTVPPGGGVGGGSHPGDGTTPFALQNGTVVTPQNPAYQYLQAACTNPNIPNVNSLPGRPYPGLGRVLALQNIADSNYNGLQITLRRARGPLTAGLSYSYSHSLDDSSDRSDPVLVNSYDLRSNYARSNFDQRHLLNISYVYQLPLRNVARRLSDYWNERDSEESKSCCSGWLGGFLDGWEMSGVTSYQSGTPFTVINSAGNTGISLTDNAGVSSGFGIAASYPDVMKGPPSAPKRNLQSFGPLLANSSQFVAPRGLTFGDAGRNFLNNPNRLNFDVALLKHFKIGERATGEFRGEVFNLFNQTQFRIYDVDNPGSTGNNVVSCYGGPFYSAGFKGSGADCTTGASFLHPIDAHRPRTVQFGLKIGF